MTFVPFLKAAAVGVIFAMWAKLTIEAFNLSLDIITIGKETLEAVRKAVCEKCGKLYDDDNFHVIIERCLCFDCRE